jgi:hypothetical protein
MAGSCSADDLAGQGLVQENGFPQCFRLFAGPDLDGEISFKCWLKLTASWIGPLSSLEGKAQLCATIFSCLSYWCQALLNLGTLFVQVRAARQRAVSADNSESIAQQIAETLVMRAKIAKAQDNVTALAIDFFSVEQPRAREPVLKK